MTNDDWKAIAAGIVGLIAIVLISVGITTWILSNSRYSAFNNKEENRYAVGTFQEAKKVVDTIMASPTFEWIGDEHGYSGKGSTFSVYDICYHDVSMKLSKKDYEEYLKYLKQVFVSKSRETTPTWKDIK